MQESVAAMVYLSSQQCMIRGAGEQRVPIDDGSGIIAQVHHAPLRILRAFSLFPSPARVKQGHMGPVEAIA